ncbi:MAG: PLD nuclease N-terminal domain-containing protein [Verrucomicrobiota bacterium]
MTPFGRLETETTMAASGGRLFTGIVIATLALIGLLVLLPALLTVLGWVLFVAVPLILLVAGIFSCVASDKKVPLKVLWLLVIFLAPLLGPLLWFFWGKKHT